MAETNSQTSSTQRTLQNAVRFLLAHAARHGDGPAAHQAAAHLEVFDAEFPAPAPVEAEPVKPVTPAKTTK